jgi:hypothetical protein
LLWQSNADAGAKPDRDCDRSTKSHCHRNGGPEPNRHCNRNSDGNRNRDCNSNCNGSAESYTDPNRGTDAQSYARAGLLALDQSFVGDRRA